MKIYLNVSNTVFTRSRTGIQRVVRQLCAGLVCDENFIALAWQTKAFYRLTAADVAGLLAAEELSLENKFDFGNIERGDVFFDLDASWADPYDITRLYKLLKKSGVIVVKMHYDAVPVLYPQFSHANTVFAYTENFAAALQYADHWITISNTVYGDLRDICRSIEIAEPSCTVLPLGADFGEGLQSGNPPEYASLLGRYMLCVGTLEPRKNYRTVLDLFEKLNSDGQSINLVIAGKQGWNSDELAKEIVEHQCYQDSLFWYKSASDLELQYLYDHAYLTLCPSFYEGYGLPVVESLGRRCVTVCTAGGAMEEVANGAAYCVEPSVEPMKVALQALLQPDTWKQYRARASFFELPRWSDCVGQAKRFLLGMTHIEGFEFLPKQAVYISIRPDSLFLSLTSVVRYMSFINSAVILTSDQYEKEILKLVDGLDLDIELITESELGITDLPEDHQARNTMLRRKLYADSRIDPNFIAFDDDSLVIHEVVVEDFIANGRHKAYYFFEQGEDWLGAYPDGTSFDRGLWRTVRYLGSCGFDTHLYNSHMPQIINKSIIMSILDRTSLLGFDEWSIYFNMAKHLYPGNFEDCVYRAIGWPQTDAPWVPVAVPQNPLFLNYYDKDVSRLVAGSAELAEIEDTWLQDIKYKKMLRDSIEPKRAELTLSPREAKFSGQQIKCYRSADIFIKLLAEKGQFKVRFRYGHHHREFSQDSLPRFLAFPASVFYNKLTDQLKVEVESKELEQKFELAIPVKIDEFKF